MRIPLTMVSRALSGDATCLHRLWAELRQRKPEGDSAQLAKWNLDHTKLLRRAAADLPGDLEAEVPVMDASGISGRVDLVQLHGGERVVHEFKAGRVWSSDVIQTMLYVCILAEQRKNVSRGFLHRPWGKVEIKLDELPRDLLQRAREMAETLRSSTPPPRIQEQACFWCKATCPFGAKLVGSAPSEAIS